MQRTVQAGHSRLTYTLTRKRVKNLNLRVDRQGEVQVSAAPDVPARAVDAFVRAHAAWIEGARRDRARQNRPNHALYLEGQPIAVAVRQGPKAACLRPGRLDVALPEPTAEALAAAVEQAKREWAAPRFAQALDRVFPLFAAYGIAYPELGVRKLRSRWGSCQPAKRRITLSLDLICVPPDLLDGVVAHELAHLVEPNHSPAFYRVLRSVQPDYKRRREALAAGQPYCRPWQPA